MATLKKILKSVLIFIGPAILLYIVFKPFFGWFGSPYHSKQEFINNYTKRQTEIIELKNYFNSIVPKEKQVKIEFESDKKISDFEVSPVDVTTDPRTYPMFFERDLETSSTKVDSILKTLEWTPQIFKTLKEKLDKADCIRIESGEPTRIGWQRSGLGMYSYNLFDKPITDSLKKYYNDSCTYILYDSQLVLEYGGGAVGPQCFSKK